MTKMSRLSAGIGLFAVIFSCLFTAPEAYAQPQTPAQAQPQQQEGAAVVVNGKRLFVFYSNFDGKTPLERAERTSNILRHFSQESDFDINSIQTLETAQGTDILSGRERIATVSGEDARVAKSSPSVLARDFAGKIRYALAQRIEKVNAGSIATGVGLTLLCTMILIFVLALVTRLTTSLIGKLKEWRGHRIKAIKIQQAELIGEHSLYELVVSLTRFAQITIIILIFAGYVLQCLTFFPGTRHLSKAIIANAIAPVHAFFDGVIDFIPETLALVGIVIIAYLVNSFAQFIFNAIEDSTIRIADFDPDWAVPTYKLVRGLICVIAVMVALPYMPGWGSPAFNQVGLLLGLLVSLGSTGVVGNVMAGTVLTYTNAFKLGDRVKKIGRAHV